MGWGAGKRIAIAFAAACVLSALSAVAPAGASRIERSNGYPVSGTSTISVEDVLGDAPGELNQIQIGIAPEFPDDYRIKDTAGITDPLPAYCVRESPTSVRCSAKPSFDLDIGSTVLPVNSIAVNLGGLDDEFSVLEPASIPSNVELYVYGGLGNDTISGRTGPGHEELFGNDGDDTLVITEPTAPTDDPDAPSSGKIMNGGDGDDTVVVVVNPHARAFMEQTEPALAAAGSKRLVHATMLGEGGNDKMTGGPAPDKMNGGPGRDVLKGKGGNDKIDCGAGKRDLGVGGPGRDLGKNCETSRH